MSEKTRTCAHPPCNCPVKAGDTYCSAQCAAMAKTPIWPASATTPTARAISVLKLPEDPSETHRPALPRTMFSKRGGRTRDEIASPAKEQSILSKTFPARENTPEVLESSSSALQARGG